jgi:hypothetical protein
MSKTKSGNYWIDWADHHAKTSKSLTDLVDPFRGNVRAFITALEGAGAKVKIAVTRRSDKRAYLFHWCWLIGLDKKKPSDAPPRAGVPIEWDHGDPKESIRGAKAMISGFGLAVPDASHVAPALHSNHIAGKAIDMKIIWSGTIHVKKKDGTTEAIQYMQSVNQNSKLHAVGASYGVKKLKTDAPHWSYDGR